MNVVAVMMCVLIMPPSAAMDNVNAGTTMRTSTTDVVRINRLSTRSVDSVAMGRQKTNKPKVVIVAAAAMYFRECVQLVFGWVSIWT